MGNSTLVSPALASLAAVCILLWARKQSDERKVGSIPAVGLSGLLGYYTGGWRFLFHGPEMLAEGCAKYHGRVFRVPRVFRWNFVVSGADLIQDVVTAPENVLSSVVANRDALQLDYTMGRELSANMFHIDIVRTKLTRNLGRCFPDIRDEISCAFDELIASDGTDWKPVAASPMVTKVVARTLNHMFAGLPICRNEDYLDLAMQYTIDVVLRAQLISLLPSFLRPIFGPLISSKNQSVRKGLKHLGPIIEYRIEQEKQHGSDWPGKPNDYLSWLLESVDINDEHTAADIVSRILAMNMAGIHTTSSVFTQALFDLTAHPTYIAALREEAEQVVEEHGWTKAALNKMHKIDSFLRESQRMHDNGPVSMTRQVLDPLGFKFSDGTVVPYGSIVNVTSRGEHFNKATYQNPDVFDGYRFYKMREERDGGLFNRHMVSTSLDHLSFGHKLHACPGRFLAAAELKTMLAHLVINYDLRAEIEGVRPPDDVFGIDIVPNGRANIWFRKRCNA
ncbi:cytochrome P450 [Mycena sanguinolenta]|nr:cytochrome P450 [Mycena sanguinolenta]